MNRSKAILAMIMLTFSVALSVLFSINTNETNSEKPVEVTNDSPSSDSEAKASGNLITVPKSEKYFLTVEGDSLRAYRVSDGNRECVDSAQIDPMLVGSEDLKKLEEGIFADSFEDLCLYFESYTS